MYKKAPRIVILLLNCNETKDTLECLDSLKKIDYPNFQTILIDNGTSDHSVAFLRSLHPEIPILETKENLGTAEGNNRGIQWALSHHAEWILLLNNDTMVAPDCLHAFLDAVKQRPQAKIFGAKTLQYHEPCVIDHLGGMWMPQLGMFLSSEQGTRDHPYFEMKPVDCACGAALFFHICVPQTIGLLETRYFHFWGKSDFCTRAKKAGFEIWTVPKAKIWHKDSSSLRDEKPHLHYHWWRSRLLWIERNCTPQEKHHLHTTLIFPKLYKMLCRYLVTSFFSPHKKSKKRHYLAGCMGALDYYRGYFGNCPKWLLKKK